MRFAEKLRAAVETSKSLVCVGLDIDLRRVPHHIPRTSEGALAFNRAVIEATCDLVCAYKPNLAFYLNLGAEGLEVLKKTREAIPSHIPAILDAKWGDVGHTGDFYARVGFEQWGFDAVTLNPYLGYDAIAPFLEWEDRAVFLLARTSNLSARDFQDAMYEQVVERAKEWNEQGNCGLVVGATFPEELARIRALAPELIFLVPGVGAQGGDLVGSVRYGATSEGLGPIISSSRGILYAGVGEDFAEAARRAADELRRRVNSIRQGRP